MERLRANHTPTSVAAGGGAGLPPPRGFSSPWPRRGWGLGLKSSFLVFLLREKGECTLAKTSRASIVTNVRELCLQKPKKVRQWGRPCGGRVREALPPRPPCPGVGLSYGCPQDMLLPEASPCQAVRWAQWYRPGGAVDGLKGLARVRDPQLLLCLPQTSCPAAGEGSGQAPGHSLLSSSSAHSQHVLMSNTAA